MHTFWSRWLASLRCRYGKEGLPGRITVGRHFRGVVPCFVCENIIDVNVKVQHNSDLLQPLRWRCVDCVIHHEWDVREEQQNIYVARTRNNRVIVAWELYCCLMPQCEALRTCRSGFSDRNRLNYHKA